MLRKLLCFLGIHSWIKSDGLHNFSIKGGSFNLRVKSKICEHCHYKLIRIGDGKSWYPGKLDKVESRSKNITDILDN